MPDSLKATTKVGVFNWPSGTLRLNRWLQGARSQRRAILVEAF
jgi:hypothetical protein